MKKFFLKSMGCKSNQYEGQIVAQNLIKDGYEQVKNIQEANFYILNSCSVTQKSDNEAYYLLRHAHSCGLKTILTGCIAQIEKESLLKEPYIDYVFGNEDKFELSKFLDRNIEFAVKDLMNEHQFHEVSLTDTAKTRVSLKIQDGCDNRCSYCIIPYGRGKSRSADEDFVINEINKYYNSGFKEVVLTGIHIGLWGKESGKSILDLVRKIETETKIPRYRLGSLNPHEITKDLLDFLQESEKFCPHFHLSLQSACNSTLKRMNRFYTAELFLDQIEDINSRFKNPFLGSDIIAGFVGETEQEFGITIENLKKSGLSQIHVFPYSIRKGTLAEKLSGHIDEKVKEERALTIKKISSEKYKDFIKKNIGTEQEVLLEKNPDKQTGMFKGLTKNYINVLLRKGKANTLEKVILTKENIKYKDLLI